MHRTEHCNRKRRALRLSAPRPPFFAGCRINASTRAATAFRPEPETRNGLSLSRNGCRFSRPPFRGQSSRPATSSRCLPITQPVRLFRSATLTGSPRLGLFPSVAPVAASSAGSVGCPPRLHSPSGLLPPFGSKRSAGPATFRLAFRTRPISLRSPQPFSISSVSATDHRSRSATFPEACCSSNLLEPSSLCSSNHPAVNGFCAVSRRFQQHISLAFRMGYALVAVNPLWIKHRTAILC
jgi:hypothetical protein